MDEFINGFFGKASIALILIVLGVNTLRSIIAYSGWLKNSKYAWLVHDYLSDEQARRLIRTTLEEVGIIDRKHQVIKNLNRHSIVSDVSFDSEQDLRSLLILLSKYTYKTDETVIYGKNTPTKTNYYINTMDASLNAEDNNLMCAIARQLLVFMYTKHKKPDFVIVPKMGNPTFVTEFAKQSNILCLLRKADNDHSRVKFEQVSKDVTSIVNLEGAHQLQQLANNSSTPLYGVVLDCNCSGGSSLLLTATEFNQLIQDHSLNITPIDYTYVLFRPDVDVDINTKFRDKGIELIRYFDLNEDIKKQLYELKLELIDSNYEVYRQSIKKKLDSIIINLNKKHLLKKGQ